VLASPHPIPGRRFNLKNVTTDALTFTDRLTDLNKNDLSDASRRKKSKQESEIDGGLH
jgi:hypothetical protein